MNSGDVRLPSCTALKFDRAGLYVCPGFGRHYPHTEQTFEMIYVTNGRVTLYERDLQFQVEKDHALLFHPKRLHGSVGDYEKDLAFFWLHFYLKSPRKNPAPATRLPQLQRVVRPDRLREFFQTLISSEKNSAIPREELDLLTWLILVEASSPACSDDSGRESLVAKIDEVIEQNLHKGLTIPLLAEALSFTPGYLGRLFHKTTGVLLQDHLLEKRIQKARHLLFFGDIRIKEVAQRTGFCDVGHLNRVFKRKVGMTAGKFRREHGRPNINSS